MNQYYQRDIFCHVSKKSDGVVVCNKAGRVYIIWENSVSGEKYLQILDISEKPVSNQKHIQGSSQTGTQPEVKSQKSRTSVNKNMRTVVIKAPAKVRGVTLRGKKKALKASWQYISGSSGYQVICSRSRKFSKKKKIYTKGTSVKIRRLKRKKTYYVKVRAYTVKNGKRVYGKWSKVKKCRVR